MNGGKAGELIISRRIRPAEQGGGCAVGSACRTSGGTYRKKGRLRLYAVCFFFFGEREVFRKCLLGLCRALHAYKLFLWLNYHRTQEQLYLFFFRYSCSCVFPFMPWGIKSLPLSFFLKGKRKKKNREQSTECGCFRLWALDRLPGEWQVDNQVSLCPESGRWL